MSTHYWLFQILCILACTAPAAAQQRQMLQAAPAATFTVQKTLTGKERLGSKWRDEQRTDNCNVPIDKRGTKPRPSTCRHIP